MISDMVIVRGQNPRQCEKGKFVARKIQFKNKYSLKWPLIVQNQSIIICISGNT